ncbi:hypothetical protein NEF87_003047 [Candidatus Lokiarchaeum ossiferum]|uniref:Uncharacterized protein n=1 Tax=Candidatus Lokiarchaeum ossiferum TaxID=2951803 RepID=A0ABY6HWN4_9ARCH|nr:hypothetical protein NEF87_003047 [Candidatus Lokiarchaeum sp. B-35]
MNTYTFENMAEELFSQFAGMHILYQIAIVAITVFLAVMSFAFIYNMITLAFTFTQDMVKMVFDLVKKLLHDLDKTMQKLFGTQPFMPVEKVKSVEKTA